MKSYAEFQDQIFQSLEEQKIIENQAPTASERRTTLQEQRRVLQDLREIILGKLRLRYAQLAPNCSPDYIGSMLGDVERGMQRGHLVPDGHGRDAELKSLKEELRSLITQRWNIDQKLKDLRQESQMTTTSTDVMVCPTRRKRYSTEVEAGSFAARIATDFPDVEKQQVEICESCNGYHLVTEANAGTRPLVAAPLIPQDLRTLDLDAKREKNQLVLSLLAAGNTKAQVAVETGLTPKQIEGIAYRNPSGHAKEDRVRTGDSLIERARPLIAAGKTVQEIAVELDTSMTYVHAIIHRVKTGKLPRYTAGIQATTIDSISTQEETLRNQLAKLAEEKQRLIDANTLKITQCLNGSGVYISKADEHIVLSLKDAEELVEKLTAYLALIKTNTPEVPQESFNAHA